MNKKELRWTPITYTIKVKTASGGGLLVTIPELGITVETAPGKTSRDDATDIAQQAIIQYHMKQREESQAKVS
jgi:hypothetical protein